MPSDTPKLRGSPRISHGPWPLGAIPDAVLFRVGKCLVHHLALGHTDLSGDDFGNLLAWSVEGDHRGRPLGVVDVMRNGCGWSVKTVKAAAPHDASAVRLISGRNSPDYSLRIADPRKNIQATGRAVLAIWNSRVNASLDDHDELRLMVLVRNMDAQEFLLFEEEIVRFPDTNYRWSVNTRGNLEGHDISTGTHCFTWQPHGAQFTIRRLIPGSARRFAITRTIPRIEREHVWNSLQYDNSWIDVRG